MRSLILAAVVLFGLTGQEAQAKTPSTDGTIEIDPNKTYRLHTKFQGEEHCLEGNQVKGSRGGNAFMDTCQNVTGQMWKFVPAGNGHYRMKTVFQGDDRCLEGNQVSSTYMNGAAFMDTCQNVTGQLWQLVPSGEHFRLKNQFRGDGECMEGNEINGSAKNGAAFMNTCQDVTGQLWFLEEVR